VYLGSPAVAVCGKIVMVWPGRPKVVVKTFVVTVVGSPKRLTAAIMRTRAIVIAVAVTMIRDALRNRSKD
jgi:hypothetical protein